MHRAASFVLLALGLCLVFADTPASCMYEDIRGVWDFNMDAGGKTNTVNCSAAIQFRRTYTINLTYPDIAIGPDGEIGFWTMIYNQGFEVRINGRIFFAFSYYEQKGGKVTSFCSTTFGGWYHNADQSDWGCYVGKKHGGMIARASQVKNAEAVRQSLKFVNDAAFIADINAKQSSWTATAYPELEHMTIGQIESRAGTKQSSLMMAKTQFAPSEPAHHASTVADDDAFFDWRNVSGVNYVSPVRNQGSCGSCYAFAAMGSLEARIRVKSKNKLQPILSTQDVVSCSQYSQGCEGGFPYLTGGKYAMDFGVVEESCFPYTAKETPCSQRCSNPESVWRSLDYHYIGGYYGACTEPLMRQEIKANGPIAVSFMVYPDLHNYKGGIYRHVTDVVTFNPFELTNHVVVIVGWGEENGQPYWIVKNSWGNTWGENGYFRIARGVDECAIESLAVAIDVSLDHKP